MVLLHRFVPHFLEVKRRLLYCAFWFVLCFCLGFFYAEKLLFILEQPLIDHVGAQTFSLVQTSLMEIFFIHCKLSGLFALIMTTPFLGYHLYAFCAPGLYAHEKKLLAFLLFGIIGLCSMGLFFAYYITLPLVCQFCIALNSRHEGILLMPRLQDYFSLLTSLCYGFMIAFQVPMVLLVLVFGRIISVQTLRRLRKHFLVLALIFAAILTPPDIISQIMVAIPMLVLYELVIFLGLLVSKGAATANISIEQHK